MPGEIVSIIPQISNLGAECYVRVKVNYINETIMNEYIIKWDELEKIINDKKLKKMKKNHKKILTKYFNDNNNKEILLKIFKQDDIDFFLQETNLKNYMKNY